MGNWLTAVDEAPVEAVAVLRDAVEDEEAADPGARGVGTGAGSRCGERWDHPNTIHPGAVEGPRIQAVLDGRAEASHRTVEEERERAMANQSVERFVPQCQEAL